MWWLCGGFCGGFVVALWWLFVVLWTECGFLWFLCGLPVVCPWSACGLPVVSCGLSAVCPWSACGPVTAQVDAVRRKYRFQQFSASRGLLALALKRRTQFYMELVRYLAFVVLLFFVLWSQPVHFPFERNSVVREVFAGAARRY